jgi:methionyl-tRNA formyltransferase
MKILFLGPYDSEFITWIKSQEKEVIISDKKINLNFVKGNKIDFIICYKYRYIIHKDLIFYLNNKIINLHISFLPWNRGADPNIWSFIDKTPKGVSIHLINEGLDKGDILVQKEVFFDLNNETLKSSYDKLNQIIKELFKKNWNDIKSNRIKPKKQKGKGSYHKISDLFKYKKMLSDLSWETNLKLLSNIRNENSRI